MKTVGLFETKAKLSEICEQVAKRGEGVVVTRRGKPLVRIDPIPRRESSSSIWDERSRLIAERGPMREDFALPARSREGPDPGWDDCEARHERIDTGAGHLAS